MENTKNKKIIHRHFVWIIFLLIVAGLFTLLLFKAKKDIRKQRLIEQVAERIAPAQFFDDQFVQIMIGDTEIFAEIARSDAKKREGIMGHKLLKQGNGMLFVFDSYGKYSFWNKDTLIPLDVLWVRDDVVVDIYENLPDFQTSPNFTITPRVEANLVIEVNAGFVKEHNIIIGDSIKIKN